MRVDVKIPGGVVAYVIDLRGERHEATPEIWTETYVSALLRAILYSDDPAYYLDAYRKLDPITSVESEIRFLQATEQLFMKGAFRRSAIPACLLTHFQVGKLAPIPKSKWPRSSQTI